MDPNTDALLNQYATSTDPAVQKQAIIGLEKIMVEQLPSIPLTNEPYWYQYNTSKFVGWPDQQHPFAAPGTANYPDIEYVVLNLHHNAARRPHASATGRKRRLLSLEYLPLLALYEILFAWIER